jgi:hypothetical protein
MQNFIGAFLWISAIFILEYEKKPPLLDFLRKKLKNAKISKKMLLFGLFCAFKT